MEALLRQRLRASGEPLKRAVNKYLRLGMQAEAKAPEQELLKVKPFRLGLPKHWDYEYLAARRAARRLELAMRLLDANLLLLSYDQHAVLHKAAKLWLEGVLSGGEAVGIPMLSVAAFLRSVQTSGCPGW